MDERKPTGTEADQRIEAAEGLLSEHATMVIASCTKGAPWIARVFFVDDEPSQGKLDLCCALVAGQERLKSVESGPVAFFIGGDEPGRWATGSGVVEHVGDDDDQAAIIKRLRDTSWQAEEFLAVASPVPVRIHVERLTVTDLDASPPVAEFTFA
jgi:hypothetical protein